ncbi:MAG: RNA polymerase sigma-54 factor [Spirochaetaceae bacterium]|nr:MAG: RNA polymerase sigma-54 factor [Spirochaetaceae bacterium]
MQSQKPYLVQEQRLKMSPQLYQSIQIMAMPIQDLRFRIQQEVEANPALEILEEKPTVSLDESPPKNSEELEYFENSSDPGFTQRYDDESSDNKRQFMEGALTRPESLHEHLFWQLRLQPISSEFFSLGELLIQNLDANGFHREPPRVLVPEDRWDDLDRMQDMIRSFEPVGTCVADFHESLLVQARLAEDAPAFVEDVIAEHLDLLERGRYAEIARKLKTDEETVLECLAFIRTLTPFPGRLFSSDSPTYVVPDLLVTMKDGRFVIIMNDEEIPVLGMNSFFTELAGSRSAGDGADKTAKRFAASNIKNAQWFINSIHQRNRTLLKTARAILDFQRDFFLKGPKFLVPLTLKDIANEIGVHEATVSRIANGKYMQTEWGIFEIRYFFTNSISGAGSSGSRFSKEGVKQTIREILEQEAGTRHMSDQKIADLLSKRGIKIARRTVAKYRGELDISSSYER